MNRLISRMSIPFARLSIFVIYFWFGLLKVIGESPASPMVKSLFELTVNKNFPSLTFSQFIIIFGIFEMLIGILFLVGRFDKLAFILLLLHLCSTFLPLFVMKGMVWNSFLVPTMEGQYIIKNVAILGLALFILKK